MGLTTLCVVGSGRRPERGKSGQSATNPGEPLPRGQETEGRTASGRSGVGGADGKPGRGAAATRRIGVVAADSWVAHCVSPHEPSFRASAASPLTSTPVVHSARDGPRLRELRSPTRGRPGATAASLIPKSST